MPAAFLIALMPLTVVGFFYYAIKLVVDARTRNRIIDSNRSDELIRSYLALEAEARRSGSLRVGIVSLCIAAGFAVIGLMGWEATTDRVSLAAVAVLIGAVAIGNLLHHLIASKARKDS
jgi:hypothetical protein